MKPRVMAIIPFRGCDPEMRDGRMVSLAGKPILAYTVQAAAASHLITRIIISTDDPEAARLAATLGAEVPFLRPSELTAPGVSLAKVLQHALLWLEEHERCQVDIVVLLEITHPIRPPGLVDRVIEVLLSEKLDSVFVAREERHEFWTFNSHRELERIQPSEEMPRDLLPPLYKEMGGMVTAMRAELVRTGRRLGDRIGLVPVRDPSSLIDLHDEDGYKLAEALLQPNIGIP